MYQAHIEGEKSLSDRGIMLKSNELESKFEPIPSPNVGTSESHKEILSDLDDENKECDRDFSNSRDQIYESSNFDRS